MLIVIDDLKAGHNVRPLLTFYYWMEENLGRPLPGDRMLLAALHCKVIIWPVLIQSLFSVVKLSKAEHFRRPP